MEAEGSDGRGVKVKKRVDWRVEMLVGKRGMAAVEEVAGEFLVGLV